MHGFVKLTIGDNKGFRTGQSGITIWDWNDFFTSSYIGVFLFACCTFWLLHFVWPMRIAALKINVKLWKLCSRKIAILYVVDVGNLGASTRKGIHGIGIFMYIYWLVVSNIFLFSPLPGEMIQIDEYFWNGWKPPTSLVDLLKKL